MYLRVIIIVAQFPPVLLTNEMIETQFSLSLSLLLLLHPCRSQRDVSGERERRLRELHEREERLKRVEAEIATADNDKNQFHNAAMRSGGAFKEKQ